MRLDYPEVSERKVSADLPPYNLSDSPNYGPKPLILEMAAASKDHRHCGGVERDYGPSMVFRVGSMTCDRRKE